MPSRSFIVFWPTYSASRVGRRLASTRASSPSALAPIRRAWSSAEGRSFIGMRRRNAPALTWHAGMVADPGNIDSAHDPLIPPGASATVIGRRWLWMGLRDDSASDCTILGFAVRPGRGLVHGPRAARGDNGRARHGTDLAGAAAAGPRCPVPAGREF